MNIANLDLNLLKLFDAVMLERNVTRASRRLFLSQPAVSNGLARLRHALKDELFIRTSQGMAPTRKAEALAGPVRQAIALLEEALDAPEFDPSTAERTLSIATHDMIAAILMPRVARHLEVVAPRIDLRLLPLAGRALELLDTQQADLAISAFGALPSRFDHCKLTDSDYVCLMSVDNPLARGRLTLKRFAAARHLLVTPRGEGRGFVDEALEARGLSRRLAMTVNHFSVAPYIVAGSDLVVTLPRAVAVTCADDPRLVHKPCPVPAPSDLSSTWMVWHRRLGDHDALRWLRGVLLELAADLRATATSG